MQKLLIRTTGLAGGLLWPYKGLLPALGLKTHRKLASRNIISLRSPKGLILLALFYWLTRKRGNILCDKLFTSIWIPPLISAVGEPTLLYHWSFFTIS